MMTGTGYETLLPLCQGRGNSVVLFMFQSPPSMDLDKAMHALVPLLLGSFLFSILLCSFPHKLFLNNIPPENHMYAHPCLKLSFSGSPNRKLCNQISLFVSLSLCFPEWYRNLKWPSAPHLLGKNHHDNIWQSILVQEQFLTHLTVLSIHWAAASPHCLPPISVVFLLVSLTQHTFLPQIGFQMLLLLSGMRVSDIMWQLIKEIELGHKQLLRPRTISFLLSHIF